MGRCKTCECPIPDEARIYTPGWEYLTGKAPYQAHWSLPRMDTAVIVGTVGTLVGVALGSWITAASQRGLAREANRRDATRARESSYVEYLAAFRNFRRFVQAEATTVRIVERPEDPGRRTPVIADSIRHWEAVENAKARMYIVAAGKPVLASMKKVEDAFYDIAEARAEYGVGAIPDSIVTSARAAETAFSRAAHDDLQAT
jgi:hypothetical protein